MNKLQEEISKWQMETFKSSDDVAKYNHLIKEVVELKDAIASGRRDDLAMEIADCCFLLFGIASLNDIDVIESMEKSLK